MAGFRKDKTTAAQTAANVAGNITAAQIAAVGGLTEAKAANFAVKVFEALFEKLGPVVEADNEVFAAVEQAEAASGKSTTRAASGAGKGRAAGASKSAATKTVGSGGSTDDPGSIKLDRGYFKGLTLREVEELSEEDAATYGYERGAGSAYIDYLVGDQNRNKFLQDMATKMREEG